MAAVVDARASSDGNAAGEAGGAAAAGNWRCEKLDFDGQQHFLHVWQAGEDPPTAVICFDDCGCKQSVAQSGHVVTAAEEPCGCVTTQRCFHIFNFRDNGRDLMDGGGWEHSTKRQCPGCWELVVWPGTCPCLLAMVEVDAVVAAGQLVSGFSCWRRRPCGEREVTREFVRQWPGRVNKAWAARHPEEIEMLR